MVEQDEVKEPDLPEPKRRLLSPEEQRLRQWRLLVIVLTFIAIYASMHKVLVPVFLKFTPLRTSPYSYIDFSVVIPFLLLFLVRKYGENNGKISSVAGMLIVYGGYEVYEVFQGYYPGWLAFSRLLSSVPMALASIYLMSQRKFGGSIKAAWISGSVFLGLLFWFGGGPLVKNTQPTATVKEEIRNLPSVSSPACGATEVGLLKGQQPRTLLEVRIESCGLSPSIVSFDGEIYLSFRNSQEKAANLHLVASQPGGHAQTLWNLLVPAKGTTRSRSFKLPPGSVGLLYSDSAPEIGVVALTPTELKESWTLKRKPISLEVR